MDKINRQLAANTTALAIEETSEFKYIGQRIESRANLGYNYLKVIDDEELERCLGSFSIFEYLQYLGFIVSATIIKWTFND